MPAGAAPGVMFKMGHDVEFYPVIMVTPQKAT